jgi:hypothetical protein
MREMCCGYGSWRILYSEIEDIVREREEEVTMGLL